MKRSTTLTIVLITARQLVRADFDGPVRDDLTRLWRAPRSPDSRGPEALRAALRLGGPAGKRVVVLSEDFWAQSTVLNTAQTEGLAPPDIARALGFEIEPFSNVPPHDSVVGYRAIPSPGDRTTTSYWVVETSRSELAAIQHIVAETGGRLTGASHPGGLPEPIGEITPGAAWQRLELWPRSTLHVSSTAAGDVQVQSLMPGPWDPDPMAPSEYGEVLSGDAGMAIPATLEHRSWPRLNLHEDAGLRPWLRAWAQRLDSDPRQLALMIPRPLPTPVRQYVTIGIILECAVAALAFGHGSWFTRQRNVTRRQLAVINESMAHITRVEQDNAHLKRSIDELSQANHTREEHLRRMALQRHAIPTLLRLLGSMNVPEMVIQDIRDEGASGLLLSGLSMTAGGTDDLLTQLTDPLQTAGWRLKPVKKEARHLLDNGGPWHFEIRASRIDPLSTDPDRADAHDESSTGVTP